ncbi:MAG: hypothetical protein QOE61_14 [Micromonosporaceae bacterium]|jgi:hypothetical protein|nr:hypothetical protein [Micromonosporaceae bacterium]
MKKVATSRRSATISRSRWGRSLPEKLLSTEDGHEGQRVDYGCGHLAEFVGYRDKSIDTVLGRVRVRRAYYHCRACHGGVVPRDAQLGVAGASLSTGLRRMVARVAAAVPFRRGPICWPS